MANLISSKGVLFFVAFFIYSCSNNYIHEEVFEVPETGWTYENKASFSFDVQDTLSIYNLLLEIDYSTDYLNQNMYVKIHTGFPKGEKSEDVLSINLADKTGKWEGACSGTNCKVLIDLQKGAFFSQIGIHTFDVEQYMRKENLEGIHAIGFMVEKTENVRQ